jgi:hypothetical protein
MAGGIVQHPALLTLTQDRGMLVATCRRICRPWRWAAWMATQSPSDRKSNLLIEMIVRSGHLVASNMMLRVPSLKDGLEDVPTATASAVPRGHDCPILK